MAAQGGSPFLPGEPKVLANSADEPPPAQSAPSVLGSLGDDHHPPPHSPPSVPESVSAPVSASDAEDARIGAGLENLGNTCFLNAVLQSFTHNVPLLESLRSCGHPSPCPRDEECFCVICALREHIENSLAASGATVRPEKLVDNLKYISSSFQKDQQEDAHEFLQCMLDRLHICSVDSKRNEKASSSEDSSFVKEIFGGRLRSQLKCCNCGHSSDTYEPLTDLSLEVENADTLLDALKMFTQVETIGVPDAKFTCENCKMEVKAEKQLTVDKAPTIATFHLKRFKNDGSYVEKINKAVDYPLELDLSPFLTNPSNHGELKYDLHAVIVHMGYYSCYGHYICYIRSSPYSWHRLDDSEVTRVSEESVLSENAYILFYAKKESPWFSSFVEMQLRPCLGVKSSTSPRSVLDDAESDPAPTSTYGIDHKRLFEKNSSDEHKLSLHPENCDIRSANLDSSAKTSIARCESSVKPPSPSDPKGIHCFSPTTPPRSPSPEAVFDQLTGLRHLMLKCGPKTKVREQDEKPANKCAENVQPKSLNRVLRTMPANRRSALMSYLPSPRKCQTEETLRSNKRRRLLDRENGHAIHSSIFSPIRRYAA